MWLVWCELYKYEITSNFLQFFINVPTPTLLLLQAIIILFTFISQKGYMIHNAMQCILSHEIIHHENAF